MDSCDLAAVGDSAVVAQASSDSASAMTASVHARAICEDRTLTSTHGTTGARRRLVSASGSLHDGGRRRAASAMARSMRFAAASEDGSGTMTPSGSIISTSALSCAYKASTRAAEGDSRTTDPPAESPARLPVLTQERSHGRKSPELPTLTTLRRRCRSREVRDPPEFGAPGVRGVAQQDFRLRRSRSASDLAASRATLLHVSVPAALTTTSGATAGLAEEAAVAGGTFSAIGEHEAVGWPVVRSLRTGGARDTAVADGEDAEQPISLQCDIEPHQLPAKGFSARYTRGRLRKLIQNPGVRFAISPPKIGSPSCVRGAKGPL